MGMKIEATKQECYRILKWEDTFGALRILPCSQNKCTFVPKRNYLCLNMSYPVSTIFFNIHSYSTFCLISVKIYISALMETPSQIILWCPNAVYESRLFMEKSLQDMLQLIYSLEMINFTLGSNHIIWELYIWMASSECCQNYLTELNFAVPILACIEGCYKKQLQILLLCVLLGWNPGCYSLNEKTFPLWGPKGEIFLRSARWKTACLSLSGGQYESFNWEYFPTYFSL